MLRPRVGAGCAAREQAALPLQEVLQRLRTVALGAAARRRCWCASGGSLRRATRNALACLACRLLALCDEQSLLL
jgi:hypothetical protein